MHPITDAQKNVMRLIQRSPDVGDGWRQVSGALWRVVVANSHPDLTDLDEEMKRVRLTAEGETVMRYLP